LERVLKFEPEFLEGYDPVIIPKARWLDPPVRVGDQAVPLSVLEDARAGVGG
jgi:hypothetical protein